MAKEQDGESVDGKLLRENCFIRDWQGSELIQWDFCCRRARAVRPHLGVVAAEGLGQTLRVGVLANTGLEDMPKDGLVEEWSE